MTRLARLLRKSIKMAQIPTDYESAVNIRDRKSIWMVEYLRARRSGDSLKGFFRRQHLKQCRNA